MLKTLLTSLLSLFWSKQENAEIVALMNLDYSAKQILFTGNITAQNIKNLVAPENGIVISYLNNATRFNGIQVNDSPNTFCSLINFGGLSNTSNSAMWVPVTKGEHFYVHQNVFEEQINSIITFIPFAGAS